MINNISKDSKMFKVPDWEDDVPKSNVNLGKRSKKEKKSVDKPAVPKKEKKFNATIDKQISNANSVAKVTAKKRKSDGSILNNKKKKRNKAASGVDANIDTDKLDELLLNAKKTKFYAPLRKDDVEHLLFKEETTENKVPFPNKISANGRQVAKIIDKNMHHKKHGKVKKKKVIEMPELGKDKVNKIFKIQTNNNNEEDNVASKNIVKKVDKKKEKLKALLQKNSKRTSISVTGNKLRERMLERLKAAQFRFINEKLYTSSGNEAKELFQSDPAAFHTYHEGYQLQVKKWPVNPLDVIVKRIQKMPKSHTIADMGCGEAALARRVPHTVRSFDLVSTAPGVEACDMARTPLLTGAVDAVVYCLSLMGTELTQYLLEAARVLKIGGHLLIAEVESRFTDVDAFARDVTRLGFKLNTLDKQHQVFFFMEFVKIREPPTHKGKLPVLTLKPCLYKKR